MILALDIGNTNIKAALFEGLEQKTYFRISCDRNKSSDEYGVMFLSMLAHAGYTPQDVTGIVFSSVVPTINFTIEHMCRNYFDIDPMSVQPGIKTGINIKYENPRELGSDRIANAVAAYELYGGPCITIDFGTATLLWRHLQARGIPRRRHLPRHQAGRRRPSPTARPSCRALNCSARSRSSAKTPWPTCSPASSTATSARSATSSGA